MVRTRTGTGMSLAALVPAADAARVNTSVLHMSRARVGGFDPGEGHGQTFPEIPRVPRRRAGHQPARQRGRPRLYRLCVDDLIPSSMDGPDIQVAVVESGEGRGLNARAVGEPPIGPSAATIASTAEAATGIRPTEPPISPERVLALLRERDVATDAASPHNVWVLLQDARAAAACRPSAVLVEEKGDARYEGG